MKWCSVTSCFLCCFELAASPRTSATELQVNVRPVFDGEPLRLDSLRYQNAAGETLSFTRLSYLLGDLALERADGSWQEFPGQFAWLDAGREQSVWQLKNVPEGKYRALRFQVGLDPATNAADPAQYPPEHSLNANHNGLHWSWQGGYIFLAMEGHYRIGNGEISGFAYHLARDANRTRIHLAATLDLTHDGAVVLDFDFARLFNAPRPLSLAKDGTATHSRAGDAVASAMVANLPGAFCVRQVLSAAPALSLPSPVRPLYLPEHFTPYRFTVSRTFPIPELPRDNPLLEERVALGKRLFNELALSSNNRLSCASCHQEERLFSDPRRFSLGVQDQVGTRQSMPLFNLAWKSSFFWDGRAPSLRAQALMPIQDPTEMGETLEHVKGKLRSLACYPPLFAAAFGTPEISGEKIGLALENYLLTLTSSDAKLDRAMQGKATLTEREKRGFELFMTEYEPRTGQRGADCFHCHGGALFSDHQFHNNGLSATEADAGRFRVTNLEADRSKFATPSLRNIERTSPYMHDGRFQTLDEVVNHYSTGVQRSPTLDPNLAKHPAGGLQLSAEEKQALVAFLKTL